MLHFSAMAKLTISDAARVAGVARSTLRWRIAALLREHPEGLSPAETRRLLGIDKDFGSTMKAMARDGLVRRVEPERYVG